MTGLGDVYEEQVGLAVSRRRLVLGLGLFLVGALLTALGVVLAATDVRSAFELGQMAAWRRAGVLAGLGVPAVIGGVFTILPSSDRVKAAAAVGAGVSVLGVALFWYAYPTHWAGFGRNLTLPVTLVYFLGMTTSVWCLFVGIANFKRRNDPGGTITLEVLIGDGESHTVEVSPDDVGDDGTVDLSGSGGSVGVFGSTPDATAETQTNTPSSSGSTNSTSGARTDGTGTRDGSGAASTSAASANTAGTGSTTTTKSAGDTASGGATGYASGSGEAAGDRTAGTTTGRADAGSAAAGTDTAAPTDGGLEDTLQSPGGGGQVISSSEHAKDVADRYCGNCEHFQYVRTDEGMQPYCGFYGEEMDDMEACEEWSPNH